MIEKLENHITENLKMLNQSKLLLAVSGGLDSMVMLHLCSKLKLDIAIAHCNFGLRNEESDGDEAFITNYAKQHKINIFINKFDTIAFAKQNKLSIQLAARKLRYDWFYELCHNQSFDYLLTAHHADDSLETFLINLSRGTGIEGLTRIPEQNNKIIRPLLHFSRNEIEVFAKQNQIAWREDSSNSSEKYIRNKIRHQIVPLLKELNPNYLDSFSNTQDYLNQTLALSKDATEMMFEKVATVTYKRISFDIEKILSLKNHKAYMYEWLKKYHFTAWDDVYKLLNAETGKFIFAPNHQLLKNRNELILSEINSNEIQESFTIDENQTEIIKPIKICFDKVNVITEASKNTIFVDADLLKYPLTIKKWEEGESFQPMGMQGKQKKLSKYFKDEKIALIDKQNQWILQSENKIVWIIGLRQDERFKVNHKTKNILKITIE